MKLFKYHIRLIRVGSSLSLRREWSLIAVKGGIYECRAAYKRRSKHVCADNTVDYGNTVRFYVIRAIPI